MRVAYNFIDSQARDVPWPASMGGEGADSVEEEEQVGKFWAYDVAGMDRMDREMDAAAVGEIDEIAKLEKMMATDVEAFHRSGASDRLMKLKTRGE